MNVIFARERFCLQILHQHVTQKKPTMDITRTPVGVSRVSKNSVVSRMSCLLALPSFTRSGGKSFK